MVNYFKKINRRFFYIALVVVLAYGLTLGMYIWQDDNAIMFKLQHMREGGGNLGSGIYDFNTPYRGVIVPLVPLYYFFGMEPAGYFAVGLVVYFLASVVVYFLAKQLSEDENLAFGAALIFAAGFVGGETLWRIYNSIHTDLNIIFVCLSLLFYSKFFKQKSLVNYLFSLLFFFIAMETGYVRAHGIIYLILGLEFLFDFHFLKSFIRVLPFTYIYYHYYIESKASTSPVHSFLSKIFVEGKIEILYGPFVTLKNIIIPDVFYVPDWLFISLLLFILIWKRSRLLWFSVIFMMQSYLAPFIHNQGQVFASLHRYLTLSLVGLALFYSDFFNNIWLNKKFYFGAILTVVMIHLYLINKEQLRIVQHVGLPSRTFYKQLKEELKSFPKGSAIYFDVKDDPESNNQFYNFFGVGSMPETTAIAIYYGVDRYDLFMPATFNELLGMLKDKKTSSDRIFTFYYDAQKGLIDTTDATRKALFGLEKESKIADLDKINFQYSSPLQLKLNIQTKLNEIKLNVEKKDTNYKKYLDYLTSKNNYYHQVTATASSQWKYQEIINAFDNDRDTSWMAHRGDWHYQRIENLTFNLGRTTNIGAIKILFRTKQKAATDYVYLCSLDGSAWQDLKHIYRDAKADYETVVDRLPQTKCKFVKLIIKNTSNEDEPQIAEFEIIDSQFSDLDFSKAELISKKPFEYLSSREDENALVQFLLDNGIDAEVCKYTNKRESLGVDDCQKIKLKLDYGQEYSLIIPQDGTVLKKLEIKSFPEIEIKALGGTVKTLSFDNLLKKGYIFEYSQN